MRVAVIGLGSIGLRHARNLLALGEAVTGYDPDPAQRTALGDAGGRAVEHRADALGESDAAVVASPNSRHLADLQAALEAGCHVMVEKPMAHTTDGLCDLLDAAAAQDLIVFVAQNLRFHPAVIDARALLADGSTGEAVWARALAVSYLPDWRPGVDYRTNYAADPATGGAVFDFIHEFDLMAHLLGPFVPEAAVARQTGRLEIGAEDCVDALLRHAEGVISNLHLDFATRAAKRVTEIGTSEGVLTIDILARTLEWRDATGAVRDQRAFGGEHTDDYVTEMRHFLACVTGAQMPLCDGREAASILGEVLALRRLAGLPERSAA
jgi:predicted dehydrogenase